MQLRRVGTNKVRTKGFGSAVDLYVSYNCIFHVTDYFRFLFFLKGFKAFDGLDYEGSRFLSTV